MNGDPTPLPEDTKARDFKAEWLAALRSGHYEQTRGRLRRDETHFCCLGVLCDVVDPKKWKGRGAFCPFTYSVGQYHGFETYLPDAIRKQTGFSEDVINQAMRMNDDGKPFSEIADYIEAAL